MVARKAIAIVSGKLTELTSLVARKPLVIVGGKIVELPAGDTLVGSTGTGGGPGIADDFSLAIIFDDIIPVETDAVSFAFTFPETILLSTDALKLNIIGLGDINALPSDLSTFVLNALYSETNILPVDTSTFAINAQYNDTNIAPTDLITTLDIKGFNDTNIAPTELTILDIKGFNDTNIAPTDLITILDIKGFNDTNIAPTDLITILDIKGFNDTNITPTELTTLSIAVFNDVSNIPTDLATFALNLALADTVPIQTSETINLNFPAPDFAETNPAPTEGRSLALRCWSTGNTSNDATLSNTVAPANINGPDDGVFCNCTTATILGDLVNPVTVTSGSMNVVGTVTVLSATVKVWFKLAASGAVNNLFADGPISIVVTSTNATPYGPQNVFLKIKDTVPVAYLGEDHSAHLAPWSFDLTPLPTSAQLNTMKLTGSYTAAVVATPNTSLKIDAWAIDIVTTL